MARFLGGGGGGGVPPLINTITQRGFTGEKNHCITAKGFSNSHTEFGAPRSRRVGVRSATN